MSVSRTRLFLAPLIFIGLTLPVYAQNSGRDASFLDAAPAASDSDGGFSGLATAPPELITPPVAQTPVTAPAPKAAPQAAVTPTPTTPDSVPSTVSILPPPVTSAPASVAATPTAAPAAIPAATPVAAAPAPAPAPAAAPQPAAAAPPPVTLTGDTAESIGMPNAGTLGAAMWKDTPRSTAERLLSFATLTNSPTLNALMRRLLLTSATPPEGPSDSAQTLTAMRIEKLVGFGDVPAAWDIAIHADPRLVDDITFHFVTEAQLTGDGDDACAPLPNLARARVSVDWRKSTVICQLRAKDTGVSATLDSLRGDQNRDDLFLDVADHLAQSDNKPLPHQLTPLTAPMLALLKMTGLPMPGELYGHPDFALVPSLLRLPAKQDVAQLGLAERAAQRGVIDGAALGAIYRTALFTPDEIAAPLNASESGSRQRALLYQAALAEKDPARRASYAIKLIVTAPPALINGAPTLAADMIGTLQADASQRDSAVPLAQIYMIAGRGSLALDWARLARKNAAVADDLRAQFPAFTLGGLEADSDYAADLDAWLDGALKTSDAQADLRAARDSAATALLLLDAAGFTVPDGAWVKVMSAAHNEKKVALSPVLLTLLQEAAASGRSAETILLAADLAGDGDIPLPAAIAITRALHAIGLKGEAATFARQALALTAKTN